MNKIVHCLLLISLICSAKVFSYTHTVSNFSPDTVQVKLHARFAHNPEIILKAGEAKPVNVGDKCVHSVSAWKLDKEGHKHHRAYQKVPGKCDIEGQGERQDLTINISELDNQTLNISFK